MSKRKIGERKEDLSDESTIAVLKKTKPLIRTDWGGQPAKIVIKNELKSMHVNSSDSVCMAVKKIAEKQVLGCRKRAYPRIDEAINRMSKPVMVGEYKLCYGG